jgi:predicted ATPase
MLYHCHEESAHELNRYFALAKFDQSRKAPFEPLMRGMGSLFRQIFSERDVSTDYHNSIRTSIRPIWPMLQKMLHLPESLLSLGDLSDSKPTLSKYPHPPNLKTWKSETPTLDSKSSTGSASTFTSHQVSAEFLRGPSSTKSLRFMNTFLEVLRALSHNKLICLCLEDLQNAGEESLDLITNIVNAKVRIVLIVRLIPVLMVNHSNPS